MEYNEDCYYFLYSKCKNPNICRFRHNQSAKQSNIMCDNWSKNRSCNVSCPYRHSDYHIQKKRVSEPCYWERKTGCIKSFCEFKHKDPKKDEWKQPKILSLDKLKQQKFELQNSTTKSKSQVEEEIEEIDNLLKYIEETRKE